MHLANFSPGKQLCEAARFDIQAFQESGRWIALQSSASGHNLLGSRAVIAEFLAERDMNVKGQGAVS
jgi:hypothetical protein